MNQSSNVQYRPQTPRQTPTFSESYSTYDNRCRTPDLVVRRNVSRSPVPLPQQTQNSNIEIKRPVKVIRTISKSPTVNVIRQSIGNETNKMFNQEPREYGGPYASEKMVSVTSDKSYRDIRNSNSYARSEVGFRNNDASPDFNRKMDVIYDSKSSENMAKAMSIMANSSAENDKNKKLLALIEKMAKENEALRQKGADSLNLGENDLILVEQFATKEIFGRKSRLIKHLDEGKVAIEEMKAKDQKIYELEIALRNTRKQYSDLEKSYQNMRESRSNVSLPLFERGNNNSSENNNLRKALQNCQRELQAEKDKNSNHLNNINELRTAIEKYKNNNAKMEEEINSLYKYKAEAEESKGEIEKLRSDIQSNKLELLAKIEEKDKQNADLKGQVLKLQSTNEAQDDQSKQFTEKISEYTNTINNLQNKLKETNVDRIALERYQNENSTLNELLENKDEALASKDDEINKMANELISFRKEKFDLQRRIETLEGQLSEYKTKDEQYKDMQEELTRIKNIKEESQRAVATKEQIINKYEIKVANDAEVIKNMQNQIDELSRTLKGFNEVENSIITNEELKSHYDKDIKHFKQEVEKNEDYIASLEEQVQSLENENHKLKIEHARIHTKNKKKLELENLGVFSKMMWKAEVTDTGTDPLFDKAELKQICNNIGDVKDQECITTVNANESNVLKLNPKSITNERNIRNLSLNYQYSQNVKRDQEVNTNVSNENQRSDPLTSNKMAEFNSQALKDSKVALETQLNEIELKYKELKEKYEKSKKESMSFERSYFKEKSGLGFEVQNLKSKVDDLYQELNNMNQEILKIAETAPLDSAELDKIFNKNSNNGLEVIKAIFVQLMTRNRQTSIFEMPSPIAVKRSKEQFKKSDEDFESPDKGSHNENEDLIKELETPRNPTDEELKEQYQEVYDMNLRQSQKIVSLYDQIAKLEQKVKTLSDKNNQKKKLVTKYNKIIEELRITKQELTTELSNKSIMVEELRMHIKDLEQKQHEQDGYAWKVKYESLYNQVKNKKQDILKELNSFVQTKVTFENSFFSEITKLSNSNE